MADLAQVELWANQLIDRHLDASWSFAFDRAKTRAGKCDFQRRTISISRYLAERHTDEQVTQTLLHEIAHAMAGHRAGHGTEWQRIAASIGYVGGRTHDGAVADEFARWVGQCPDGHRVYRFRRPKDDPMSCAKCSRSFDRRYLIHWHERSI